MVVLWCFRYSVTAEASLVDATASGVRIRRVISGAARPVSQNAERVRVSVETTGTERETEKMKTESCVGRRFLLGMELEGRRSCSVQLRQQGE